MAIRKTSTNPAQGTFAWRVKNAREQMGMTQTQVAEASGLPRCTVTAWELESAKTQRFEDVIKLAKGLDVSLDYLAGYSDGFGCFPVGAEV
ncbi:helix-turn-helix transcriptional regulator [Caballeronia sp. AZ7_KS35]|uniref:helix-turn-helix domain-containing protein n=1 Tax=Caballeronia sp. AZ7_KS35 TaxID=2921762 RepID=UPI0020280A2D|nr:helix-turn-helix transcriptional regulator [Caballeronia sp. AZ7_KS35]